MPSDDRRSPLYDASALSPLRDRTWHLPRPLRLLPVPDLTHRADPVVLPEKMDGPCSYETFRATVQDIAATTRLTLSYRPILRFLAEALPAGLRPSPPLSVVDVGCGGGDVLRRVARWAYRHHASLLLTGIDLNPHATAAARELSAGRTLFRRLQWITGDVFTDPHTQAPDVVLSSLVTHHMGDDEIVRFLRWMENSARRGWFISDLLRSRRSYRMFSVVAPLLRWHPFVQHDGLVSIRRAFLEEDWERLLGAADIPRAQVRIRRCGLGRLCLTRLR